MRTAALAMLLSLLADPSTSAPTRALRTELVVPAPVSEVWKAWATTEGIRTFVAPDGP